jgi:ribosomal protein S7
MELRSKKVNNIYTKLVGYFTKNGKKGKSKIIIINALTNASKVLDLKAIDILKRITSSLGVIVDLRTVRIRRNVFTVPVPVNSSRRNYLIIKKISKAISENKSHINLEKKLTQEIVNIIKNKNAKSVFERDIVLKEAVKNKSNLHYRW